MTKLVQNIGELLDTMHNDPEWSGSTLVVTEVIHACVANVELVADEEARLQDARIRLSEEKFKAFKLGLNQTRRMRRDVLIRQVNMLNRLAKKNKLPPIAPDVDETRPETYFEFARQVVDEYFTSGPIGSVSEN